MNRFQSIRWRLQIWYGLLLVAALAGFGIAAYRVEGDRQRRRTEEELQRRLRSLVASRHPVTGARPPRQQLIVLPETAALFDRAGDDNYYYVVWLHGNPTPYRSRSAPSDALMPEEGSDLTRLRGAVQEAFLFPARDDCLLVGHPLDRDFAELHHLALLLIAAGAAVLVCGLAGGAWLVGRALRPIRRISAAAQKVATGDLSQRIDDSGSGSELGELVHVLNSTFARLDAAFTQQARFTADAAHELRTPLSVILSQAQYGLATECDNEEHSEILEATQRAAQRMRRLIESLLELSRLDAGQEIPRRQPCNLAAIVTDCLELVRPLADERGIVLHTDLAPAVCPGDADRLSQVVTNLLTNAVYYNLDGGRVGVSTRALNGVISLEVSNTGSGIAAEDLPLIFDRFYRADTSRSGPGGRSGLGLAIVKAVVQAHGGTIAVTSATGQGANFTVRLPC